MREIKFRAWDNVKNKMYFTGEEDEVVISFDSSGLVAIDLTEHDWGFKKLEHLQYMQYTDLVDKNGVEIYEGDILESIHSKSDGMLSVIWHNNGFQIEYKFMRKYEGTTYQDVNYLPIYKDSYVVIGNIYENPKLLEGKQ